MVAQQAGTIFSLPLMHLQNDIKARHRAKPMSCLIVVSAKAILGISIIVVTVVILATQLLEQWINANNNTSAKNIPCIAWNTKTI